MEILLLVCGILGGVAALIAILDKLYGIRSRIFFTAASKTLWEPLPDKFRELSLLNWHYRLTEPYGRESEINQILTWAQQETNTLRVKILSGPGGSGKTRIAAELCNTLQINGWKAEFIPRGETFEFDPKLHFPNLRLKIFYVFDYPEERQEFLVDFLNKIKTNQNEKYHKIRVLLLSRRNYKWWEEYSKLRTASLEHIFERVETEINRITTDKNVLGLFCSACNSICEKYDKPLPKYQDEEILDWVSQNESVHSRPLFILAYAIHSVAHGVCVSLSGGEVIKALVKRERTHIDAFGKDDGFGEKTISRLVGLALIPRQISSRLLYKLEDRALHLELPPEAVSKISKTPLWRSGCILPLQPDICGAALLFEVLSEREDMASEWIWSVIQDSEMGVADTLGRIIYDISNVYGELSSKKFQAWLADMIEMDNTRALNLSIIIERRLPQVILPFAISIDKAVIKNLHKQKRDDKSKWLSILAYHLWLLGDSEGALPYIKEAVNIQKATQQTLDNRNELAEGLHTLSLISNGVNKKNEAVEAIREAVQIRKSLSTKGDSHSQYELARSLNQLFVVLEKDNPSEAQDAIEQAVSIHRDLMPIASPEMRDEFGRVLGNFVNLYGTEKTLVAIHESVEIRRNLVHDQPWRFEPSLADILRFQSIALFKYEKFQDSFDSAFESVNIHIRLVKVNPIRFGASLLSCLNICAKLIPKVPDPIKKLPIISKKVEGCEVLFKERILMDDKLLLELAQIYMHLGYYAAEYGETKLGEAVCGAAIRLLEGLKDKDPRNWSPERLWILIGGYLNRGNSIRKSDDREKAITDYSSAIALCVKGREKFGAHIDIDIGKSISLANLSIELLKDDNFDDARRGISELISWEEVLRSDLGDKWPEKYYYKQLVKSLSVLCNVILKKGSNLKLQLEQITDLELSILKGYDDKNDIIENSDVAIRFQSLGRTLAQAGYDKGYEYMKEGLELGESTILNWPKNINGSRKRIFLLNETAYNTYWYVEQKNTSTEPLYKAETWIKECLNSVSEGDNNLLAGIHSTMGQILMLRGERESSKKSLNDSMKHLEKAHTICLEHKINDTLEEVEGNIARIKSML